MHPVINFRSIHCSCKQEDVPSSGPEGPRAKATRESQHIVWGDDGVVYSVRQNIRGLDPWMALNGLADGFLSLEPSSQCRDGFTGTQFFVHTEFVAFANTA